MQICQALPVAALAAALLSCASEPPELPAEMRGDTWMWTGTSTATETTAVDMSERYTLSFVGDGSTHLRADCNRGSGRYTLSAGRRIAFGPIALTRRACPPGSLSDRYVRDVQRAESYALKDGSLALILPAGAGTMRFVRTD